MRIQYVSDLHLERYDNAVYISRNPLDVVGDILVIAGDTFPLREFEGYKKHIFFDWCAANFRETLLIPGNHEYYGSNVDAFPGAWRREIRPNVAMYQNKRVRIDNFDFILSTLWTHVPGRDWLAVKMGMQDFRTIRTNAGSFTAYDYNIIHRCDLYFIQDAVSESDAEHKVVVTHHVPSFRCVSPEFKDSRLHAVFAVDLTDLIERSGVDAWIYGHSHRSIEMTIGKTRMLSNQLGYVVYREYNNGYKSNKYIDI